MRFWSTAKECGVKFTQDFTKRSDSCLIFSGHEYMTMNLRFAAYLDDDDDFTRLVLNTIVLARNRSLATQRGDESQRFVVVSALRTGVRRAPFAIETKVAERSKTAVVATIRAGK